MFPSSAWTLVKFLSKKGKKENENEDKIKMKSQILLNSFMRASAVMCCLVCSRHTNFWGKEREHHHDWRRGGVGWRYTVEIDGGSSSVPFFSWKRQYRCWLAGQDCVSRPLPDVMLCCLFSLLLWWSIGIPLPPHAKRFTYFWCDCRQVSRKWDGISLSTFITSSLARICNTRIGPSFSFFFYSCTTAQLRRWRSIAL